MSLLVTNITQQKLCLSHFWTVQITTLFDVTTQLDVHQNSLGTTHLQTVHVDQSVVL